MDVALLKKMNIYPTEAATAGLIPDASQGESTLVKADVSLFHEMPLSSARDTSAPSSKPYDIPEAPPETSAATEAMQTADYDSGLADGKAQSDAIYEDTIVILQKSVDALQSKLSEMANEIEHSHMAAVVDCFRSMMPSLVQKATDLELQSVIRQACSAASEGTVQVRVHPDDHVHTQRLCQTNPSKISVTADAAIARGSIGVEWVSGGAEINCQAAADACLALLDTVQTSGKVNNLTETTDG